MDATSSDALRLEGLGKRYGAFAALEGVSLAIPRGQTRTYQQVASAIGDDDHVLHGGV